MDKTERLIKVIKQAETDLRRLQEAGYEAPEQAGRLKTEIATLRAKLEANREAVR